MERAINLSLQESEQRYSRGVVIREGGDTGACPFVSAGGDVGGNGKQAMSALEVARSESSYFKRVEGNYVGDCLANTSGLLPIGVTPTNMRVERQMDVENLGISFGGQQFDTSELGARGPLFNQALQESLSRILLEDGRIREDLLEYLDRTNTRMVSDQLVEGEGKASSEVAGSGEQIGTEGGEETGGVEMVDEMGPKIDALQEEEGFGGDEDGDAENEAIVAPLQKRSSRQKRKADGFGLGEKELIEAHVSRRFAESTHLRLLLRKF